MEDYIALALSSLAIAGLIWLWHRGTKTTDAIEEMKEKPISDFLWYVLMGNPKGGQYTELLWKRLCDNFVTRMGPGSIEEILENKIKTAVKVALEMVLGDEVKKAVKSALEEETSDRPTVVYQGENLDKVEDPGPTNEEIMAALKELEKTLEERSDERLDLRTAFAEFKVEVDSLIEWRAVINKLLPHFSRISNTLRGKAIHTEVANLEVKKLEIAKILKPNVEEVERAKSALAELERNPISSELTEGALNNMVANERGQANKHLAKARCINANSIAYAEYEDDLEKARNRLAEARNSYARAKDESGFTTLENAVLALEISQAMEKLVSDAQSASSTAVFIAPTEKGDTGRIVRNLRKSVPPRPMTPSTPPPAPVSLVGPSQEDLTVEIEAVPPTPRSLGVQRGPLPPPRTPPRRASSRPPSGPISDGPTRKMLAVDSTLPLGSIVGPPLGPSSIEDSPPPTRMGVAPMSPKAAPSPEEPMFPPATD